ncbi:hypothetical protein AURDEDRAFT_123492 [Auricularia subglabra TFB-10046 SS5]|nr:hypothetical protein AURDEDRAFT_123492 [Auricularia subglabra TFB-10046 SS5]
MASLFTHENPAPPPVCARGARCETAGPSRGVLPDGTPLYEVPDRLGDTASRFVCERCCVYYKKKEGTMLLAAGKAPPGHGSSSNRNPSYQLSPEIVGSSRLNVNAAWHRHASVPVHPVGGGMGYNASHANYYASRTNAAKAVNRIALPESQVVQIKIAVMYLPAGNVNLKVFGDISGGAEPAPISLGYDQLVTHLKEAIQTKWDRYTFNAPYPDTFPLIAVSSLREIAPRALMALEGHLSFSAKSIPKQLRLAFQMTFIDAERLQARHDEMEEQRSNDSQAMPPPAAPQGPQGAADRTSLFTKMSTSWEPVPFTPPTTSSQSATQNKRSLDHTRAPGDIPTTPPSKRAPPVQFVSPDRDRLRHALANQDPMKQLNMEKFHGKLYLARQFSSFQDLVDSQPLAPGAMGHPYSVTLFKAQEPLAAPGTFKVAFQAELIPDAGFSLPDGYSLTGAVCAKLPIRPETTRQKKYRPLPTIDAVSFLGSEIRSKEWADGLMVLVKAFVARELQRPEVLAQGPPPMIPDFNFVDAGLFIADGHNLMDGAFMIETLLDNKSFEKYIGNASVHPVDTIDTDELRSLARYLQFAQHVQWLKTEGHAFCSDFQGSGTLLTDPQIMTSEEFTNKFAEGNVLTGWASMVEEHDCDENEFCGYFGLEPPRDAILKLDAGKPDDNKQDESGKGVAN